MNITVLIPDALRGAVEGRRRLDLGVPSSATVGDVVQTLLQLYPRLAQMMATERRADGRQLQLGAAEALTSTWPLRDGQKLYLFGTVGRAG